jgi:hypothetical protein
MDIVTIGLVIAFVAACAVFYWLFNLPFYPEYEETSEEYPWKEWER